MYRRLKYPFLVASILFGFLIAFAIAELALRMLASDWLIHRMKFLGVSRSTFSLNFGTDLGWPLEEIDGKFVRFKPRSTFTATHYEYRHAVHIDELGGRVTAHSDQKNGETIIPFLGDSICFGIGVEDQQTYVSLLNRELKFRLVNLAIPGSSLPVHLDQIERRHKELGKPRLYVFNFFVGNDLTNMVEYYTEKRLKEDHQTLDTKSERLERWLKAVNRVVFYNQFLNKLYVVQFIRTKLLVVYNGYRRDKRKQELMGPIFLVIQKYKKDYLNQAEQYLELELERLDRLSRDLGFSTLFILLPHRDQVSGELLKLDARYYGININDIDVKLPNEMIRKKLASHHLPYIDVLDCLKKEHKTLFYIQDEHFLPIGHEVLSACILPRFREFLASHSAVVDRSNSESIHLVAH